MKKLRNKVLMLISISSISTLSISSVVSCSSQANNQTYSQSEINSMYMKVINESSIITSGTVIPVSWKENNTITNQNIGKILNNPLNNFDFINIFYQIDYASSNEQKILVNFHLENNNGDIYINTTGIPSSFEILVNGNAEFEKNISTISDAFKAWKNNYKITGFNGAELPKPIDGFSPITPSMVLSNFNDNFDLFMNSNITPAMQEFLDKNFLSIKVEQNAKDEDGIIQIVFSISNDDNSIEYAFSGGNSFDYPIKFYSQSKYETYISEDVFGDLTSKTFNIDVWNNEIEKYNEKNTANPKPLITKVLSSSMTNFDKINAFLIPAINQYNAVLESSPDKKINSPFIFMTQQEKMDLPFEVSFYNIMNNDSTGSAKTLLRLTDKFSNKEISIDNFSHSIDVSGLLLLTIVTQDENGKDVEDNISNINAIYEVYQKFGSIFSVKTTPLEFPSKVLEGAEMINYLKSDTNFDEIANLNLDSQNNFIFTSKNYSNTSNKTKEISNTFKLANIKYDPLLNNAVSGTAKISFNLQISIDNVFYDVFPPSSKSDKDGKISFGSAITEASFYINGYKNKIDSTKESLENYLNANFQDETNISIIKKLRSEDFNAISSINDLNNEKINEFFPLLINDLFAKYTGNKNDINIFSLEFSFNVEFSNVSINPTGTEKIITLGYKLAHNNYPSQSFKTTNFIYLKLIKS